MCAAAVETEATAPVLFRKVHTTIIQSVPSVDSQYSESHSENESDNRNSPNTSVSINDIPEKLRACSQNDLDSSGTVYQRSGSFTSQSLQLNTKPFYTPSINSNRKTYEHHRRIHSTEAVPHSPLREKTTIDSGTGDSVTHLPTVASPKTVVYDIVSVFGESKTTFIANRYDFDATIVAAYKSGKRSTHEKFGVSTKRNSNEPKKSSTLLSRMLRPFKHSVPEQTPFVRHHFSHNPTHDNH